MKALLLAMVVLCVGCDAFPDAVPEFEERAHDDPDLGYTVFEVEGMPCLIVGRRTDDDSLAVWRYDGVTCDWSKRDAKEGGQ